MNKKRPERAGCPVPTDDNGQPFGQKMFPLDGMTKYPVGMPIMAGAWMGCISACMGFVEVRRAFTKSTGLDILQIGALGNSQMEAIENAMRRDGGLAPELVLKWADFVTEHVWGCHP